MEYRELGKSGVSDFSVRRIVESMDESLMRLGLDYVNIFQCHDIAYRGT